MSHPENSTTPSPAQAVLTTEVDLLETPINNRGETLLMVASGSDVRDALCAAQRLSSGVAQLCQHLHDDINAGNASVYCDALYAMSFLSETVCSLVAASRYNMPDPVQQTGVQP